MMYKSVPAGLLSGFLLTMSSLSTVHAADSIEQRLDRVENLLSNQVLIEQAQQMQHIRQELAELREMLENQDHELGLIKQRQRNLYQDMDRRLHDLEAGTGGSTSSSAPIAPPGASSSVKPPAISPAGAASSTTLSSGAAGAEPGDTDGKPAYSQAFNLLKEGRYQEAIIAFRNFMQTYPDSRYTANAQYWLAEANYVSRDYKTALQEFQKIISKFPDSNKVQGAELKIGYTYYEMSDWAKAREALQGVIASHPNTTVARKAEERLQRMKREGH